MSPTKLQNQIQRSVVITSIDNLANDSSRQAKKLRHKANFYKALSIVSTVLIIILGIVIGVVSLGYGGSTSSSCGSTQAVPSVLGFSIAGLKSFMSLLKSDKKAKKLKESSIEVKNISRKLIKLRNSCCTTADLARKLEQYQKRLDQTEISTFSLDMNISRGGTMRRPIRDDMSLKTDEDPEGIFCEEGHVDI